MDFGKLQAKRRKHCRVAKSGMQKALVRLTLTCEIVSWSLCPIHKHLPFSDHCHLPQGMGAGCYNFLCGLIISLLPLHIAYRTQSLIYDLPKGQP